MNKEKILVLIPKGREYYKIKERGIVTKELYKSVPFFIRIIRRFYLKLNIPFANIWYNDWKKDINKYDLIILFDSVLDIKVIDYIRNKIKEKRFIFWYWNPVENSINPNLISENLCEKWSFDLVDCKKYNLRYNKTFYFNDYNYKKSNEIYDVFFVGRDKGRLEYLLKLEKEFNDKNIITYFYIATEEKYSINKKKLKRPTLSYEEVLDYISKSKAILEILQKGQSGASLRTMEAIFYEKKLITNNKNIINYDFYCKENIFILEKDNIEELPQFLNSSYKKIDEEIIKKYEFENWLKEFERKNE